MSDQDPQHPKETRYKSLADMAADAGRKPSGKVPICPECGRRLFYVISTWHLADGSTRRLRKCSACGHAINSTEVFDE